MEILLIIIIIYLIYINKNINTKYKNLEEAIHTLSNRLKNLQNKDLLKELSGKEEVVFEEKSKRHEEILKAAIAEKPAEIIPEKPAKEIPVPIPQISNFNADKKATQEKIKSQEKEIPKKSWIEKFKEQNPDLEKFIGENLINKIGILILVLGISFFVKYAIDKDWINEPARVGIGMLCGSLVMAIAHKLKKNYAAFSSVLVAGAISIFYFTIYIAFHEYQLFSQSVAFAIMVVITAFSTLVSVSYNRQELAVLSLIGGFAAPFMLSTGEGNYIVLFTYIAILNIGILAISYFKKWKIATMLSFLFTIVLFGGWCTTKIGKPEFSHTGALLFATLFYFIFSITIVLNNLKNKGVFSTLEYFILVANTFFFFGIGMFTLRDLESNFTGLFTLLLAVYNVVYAAILYKKFGLDKNAIYLLIGLALTFVTLTIPIQFKGNQITLFWAAEAVLLFWLSSKSKINHFKLGAIIVQILAVISLIMDWKIYTYAIALPVILNPLFISGFVLSVSLFLTYWLLKKENGIISKYFNMKISNYKTGVLIVAIIAIYFTGILEVIYQTDQLLANQFSAFSFSVTYHFVFVALVLYLTSRFQHKTITKSVLIISGISIVFYIAFFYAIPVNELTENIVATTNSEDAFYFHYIILGCLGYFGYQLFKKTMLLFKVKPKQSKWLPWVFVFAIVYILSNEVMLHSLQFSKSTIDLNALVSEQPNAENNLYLKGRIVKDKISDIKTQVIKIGYPILWGVFSFFFLIIGIKRQWKTLRIIALALLGITILKLFIYDIKNVSETGKIIAFILLGVLILVISFVYQKIKKLVIDETTENENI